MISLHYHGWMETIPFPSDPSFREQRRCIKTLTNIRLFRIGILHTIFQSALKITFGPHTHTHSQSSPMRSGKNLRGERSSGLTLDAIWDVCDMSETLPSGGLHGPFWSSPQPSPTCKASRAPDSSSKTTYQAHRLAPSQ